MAGNTVTIEDAQIFFRNFEGKEGRFNAKGKRNFAVQLTPELAEELTRLGLNVKMTNPQEEGDQPIPYLPVAVNFEFKPPRIVMINSLGKTPLHEDTVEMLDWADIVKVDLTINPFPWQMPDGKAGVKAYLKTMYVHVEEDELERKYADKPRED